MAQTAGLSSMNMVSGFSANAKSGKRATEGRRSSRSCSGTQPLSLSPSNSGEDALQSGTSGRARAERIAALKAAIEAGEYHVPASALADKLIESLLLEHEA